MAEVIKGKGVIWSIGTLTLTGSTLAAPGTHQFLPQSLSFERTSEKTNIKDNGGTVRSQIFHGFMKTLDITVVPSGTSVAAAITSGNEWTPKPSSSITLTDSVSSITDPSTYNVYNVVRSRQNRTNDGVMTCDLSLESSDEDVDITTTAS